jgi:hypothetical protein
MIYLSLQRAKGGRIKLARHWAQGE